MHNVSWNSDDTGMHFLPQDMSSHIESVYYQTAQEFLHSMHQLPMFQLSNVKNIARNVLDLVFVNERGDIQLCAAPIAITKVSETDVFHPPLEISFEYEVGEHSNPSNETEEVYLYKQGNYERMSEMINAINFAEMFVRKSVEEAFDCFYETLEQLIADNVPKRRIKKRKNKPKWWTKELQKRKNN